MFSTSSLKVISFFGVWAVIWLPLALLVARLINWQPTQPLNSKQKLILLASLYILAPIIIWWKIPVDRLSFDDIFSSIWQLSTLTSVGWGLMISLVGLATVFALESLFGLVTWDWQKAQLLWSLIIPILFLSLAISSVEELVFRSYIIQILKVDYSYWVTATISSVIFALLHLIWERKTTIPQLPGLWLMGMVLSKAVLVNRGSLALAIGLHSGWIWGLSCIDSVQLITYTGKDKSWLTGFYQQPLAGVAGISCMLATAVFLWMLPIY
jgi:uncharacterized protein